MAVKIDCGYGGSVLIFYLPWCQIMITDSFIILRCKVLDFYDKKYNYLIKMKSNLFLNINILHKFYEVCWLIF